VSECWVLPALAPPRAGFYRYPHYPLTLPVPPGLDQFLMSPIPWELWTGAQPKIRFRAPFELIAVDRQGDYLRARFRNPAGKALPLAAAIDWPMWTSGAAPPRFQRSA